MNVILIVCDWNPSNNTIISGGEDCKYKVIILINLGMG
jgi:hypothetical protein